METTAELPIYHVLLVGIDKYPEKYKSLSGCVNDIDAIERILFEPPGISIPPERIRVMRLAAPRPNRNSSSRFKVQTHTPTRARLLQALRDLAGPGVRPWDRVLFYYSGHGIEVRPQNSLVWHEALVPTDGTRIEPLFDFEINHLITAIAARTNDLTIVLDCCHSAGATRDLSDGEPLGSDRYLEGTAIPAESLNLVALSLPAEAATGALDEAATLDSMDTAYQIVVTCQADEKAGEGPDPDRGERFLTDELPQGIFTYALQKTLQGRDAAQLEALRWADIWPDLLQAMAARCAQFKRALQHPSLIGRSERRIFGGGPFELQDLGYRVSHLPEGGFVIGAGTMMGVTREAEIAVYGSTPPRFPPIGSAADQPSGRLIVVEAGRSRSVAEPLGPWFALPEGARGRLLKPGQSERLRVTIQPEDAALAAKLGQSSLIELVSAPLPDAEVLVSIQEDGSMAIGNDTEACLALVPPGASESLRAGLESYYRYQTALRLTRSCHDLKGSLSLHLLDCSDAEALRAMTPEKLADPSLCEVSRDKDGIYALPAGGRSCVRILNTLDVGDRPQDSTLQVVLLNCSAGGLVEIMGKATLRGRSNHIFWLRGELGKGFPAKPDRLPILPHGVPPDSYVTDRIIAIGTNLRDIDLDYLKVNKTVQAVVDDTLSSRGEKSMTDDSEPVSTAPVELWTATIAPLRIARR